MPGFYDKEHFDLAGFAVGAVERNMLLPKKIEIDFAEKIVSLCPEKPLYARVDILLSKNGKILLSELEIIEPELWFRFREKSADFLAKKIYESIIF